MIIFNLQFIAMRVCVNDPQKGRRARGKVLKNSKLPTNNWIFVGKQLQNVWNFSTLSVSKCTLLILSLSYINLTPQIFNLTFSMRIFDSAFSSIQFQSIFFATTLPFESNIPECEQTSGTFAGSIYLCNATHLITC